MSGRRNGTERPIARPKDESVLTLFRQGGVAVVSQGACVFTFATMQALSTGCARVPQKKRTLGERLVHELVMWVVAAVFVVIAMTIRYQVIMTVVVPDLTGGMSSSPAVHPAATHFQE